MRRAKKKLRRQQGFTLVEMLLCMAIVGIMASIAIPHMQDFAHRAYNTLAKSDMASIMRVAKTKLNLGEGGTFQLVGRVVQCDDDTRLLVLSKGVEGEVNGLIDPSEPSNNFFYISLHHQKGSKTFTYTYDGATNTDTYTET